MINERSIKAVDKSRFGPFSKPLYNSYGFNRIPKTVEALFTGNNENALPQDCFPAETFDFVLLFFIDCFGWRYFDSCKEKFPFLKRFLDEGIVSKITSQFPSTTTNHVTAIHTGLSVGESGLYEWFYYDPIVDASICPLHFSFTKDKGFNSLKRAGFSPNELFPFDPLYGKLSKLGVKSVVFQDHESAHSPYSEIMYKDAEVVGFKNLPDGLNKLLQKVEKAKDKTYFFFYYGDIDGKGHEFGPGSLQVEAAIDKTFTKLEAFFQEFTQKNKKRGALLVTADHGMIEIHPETSWYINKELPEILPLLKQNAKGELIAPCGSSRDMFLHIKEECLPTALTLLKKSLLGIAEVHLTKELIENGLFGPVTERFLERVGNVVLLPLGENSCWWYDPKRFDTPYHGHHGGLSKQELETIFLALALS